MKTTHSSLVVTQRVAGFKILQPKPLIVMQAHSMTKLLAVLLTVSSTQSIHKIHSLMTRTTTGIGMKVPGLSLLSIQTSHWPLMGPNRSPRWNITTQQIRIPISTRGSVACTQDKRTCWNTLRSNNRSLPSKWGLKASWMLCMSKWGLKTSWMLGSCRLAAPQKTRDHGIRPYHTFPLNIN